jgi:hypothetical protein
VHSKKFGRQNQKKTCVANVFIAIDSIIKLSDLSLGRYFASARSLSCWQQSGRPNFFNAPLKISRQN